VNTLIIGEVINLFNSRINGRALSIKGLLAASQVWIAVAAVMLLQIPFTCLPLMHDAGTFRDRSDLTYGLAPDILSGYFRLSSGGGRESPAQDLAFPTLGSDPVLPYPV
jgi:hypothetical protein